MDDVPGEVGLHADGARFREALLRTEAETGFSARLVEKDYCCSLVLGDLAGLFDGGLVFKGGTCLSKVHAAFFRLSEDLDFTLSIPPTSGRSERRKAAAPIKEHLAALPSRLACFRISKAVETYHRNCHYMGTLAYESVIVGEAESIKLEVSLREEVIQPTQVLAAHTLLRALHTGQAAMNPVYVRVLSLPEAYAEKIRAALTRQEPAIRDFFDIDHAVQLSVVDLRDSRLLDLVSTKLAVDGNGPVDLSPARTSRLRTQVETQLRPVLRERDYQAFDLGRVLQSLEDLVQSLPLAPGR